MPLLGSLTNIADTKYIKAVPLHVKQTQRAGRAIALPVIDPCARRDRVFSITLWQF
jgi:hypothetical protein